ncbi:MAG: response regulator, partial [Anaerolineae bacterium]|nr:response regulator [Anaerolineae bacterium]
MSMPVLIVEDNPDASDMMGRILRYNEIDFEVVQSAEEALQQMANPAQYSGLIIDLALPEMDGWTLLSVLRGNATTWHLPCVAVTAYHSPELTLHASRAGFNGYFSKPLE